MPSPARKSAARLFAACSVLSAGLILGTAGCESESEQADKAVSENIAKAQPERGEAAITGGFQAAAQEAKASPATSARAKILLAQAKAEQARAVLADVNRNEVVVSRLLAEITDIAGQVQTNNILVASYEKLSSGGSETVGKELEGTLASVQGKSAEDVWKLDGDAGTLPALSNVTARAEKLGPEIEALEAKKADLAKQRTAADAKASQLLSQSKRKTGKPALDLYTQSAAETKKAADLGTEVGKIDHALLKLQQDMALTKAQTTDLDETVKSLGERISENKKSKEELAALIEGHRKSSQALVGDGSVAPAVSPADTGDTATPPSDAPPVEAEAPAEPAAFQVEGERPAEAPVEAPTAEAPAEPTPAEPATAVAEPVDAAPVDSAPVVANIPPSTIVTNATIAAKASEFSGLVADSAKKRTIAIALLDESLGLYDQAITSAEQLRGKLRETMQDPSASNSPQIEAWKGLSELFNPAGLNLQKAGVQQLIAATRRDAVSSLAAHKRMLAVVEPILAEAKIETPVALLRPKIEEDIATAQKEAADAYTALDELLKDKVIDQVSGGSPSETAMRQSAQVAQVVAQFGRAQLLRALDDNAGADQLTNSARQAVTSGELPPEQYPVFVRTALGLKATAAAPTTAPAPAPAAAPTEDGAAPAPTEDGTAPATAPAVDGAAAPAEGTPAPQAAPAAQ